MRVVKKATKNKATLTSRSQGGYGIISTASELVRSVSRSVVGVGCEPIPATAKFFGRAAVASWQQPCTLAYRCLWDVSITLLETVEYGDPPRPAGTPPIKGLALGYAYK